MAAIYPFRALRPTPEGAARVAAVPYDVVTRDEAAALAAGNPLSFLHVSRSEIDLPAGTDPYADRVYTEAAAAFERLVRDAPLVVEDEPSLYCYRLRMGRHEQTGLAACYSLDEYDRDLIKKHERTRRDKEDDRTRHMIALGAQTGPVFLTYRASAAIAALTREVTSSTPSLDFTAPDGVRHTVWRVPAGGTAAFVDAFTRVPALYIADGHHRAASAARARGQWRSGSREQDTFLAVAFPDDQMQILPYNRVVRDLQGRSPDAFLAAVGDVLPVGPGPAAPKRTGEASMFVGGRWYTLDLAARRADADGRVGALDVSLLQDFVIGPVLGIADVRTDKRIDFVGGVRGAGELERLVGSGAAAVAFSMYPVTVGDLMAVADAGGIMPPKSTWFEPKLRDGLLIHVV
jgi:uncharacterized protein (DUF1015 family)